MLITGFKLILLPIVSAQQMEVISSLPITPVNLIEDVFLGDGIDVLDVQFEGNPDAVGYFINGNSAIGIGEGILMTTGYAASKNSRDLGADAFGIEKAGVNNGSTATDPDLRMITAPVELGDISKYIIRFIPRADTLSFKYVFASEEYPIYVCSRYNDVFGFFVSGPGIDGPFENNAINIARVPGTDLPVRINTINNGAPWDPNLIENCQEPEGSLDYSHLFNENSTQSKQPVYGGFTDIFEATIPVVPCQEYTIKLVIADVTDTNFDSGVFLEARSFGSPALKTGINTVSPDQILVEGCTPATIDFSLPFKTKQDFPIQIQYKGDATPGLDYSVFEQNLVIPAGDSIISVTLDAFEDNLEEGMETIAFEIETNFCQTETFEIRIIDNALNDFSIGADVQTCPDKPVLLKSNFEPDPILSHFFAFQGNQAINVHDAIIESELEVSGLSYLELLPSIIDQVCIDRLDHAWMDDLDIYLVAPGGAKIELTTDNGGNGQGYQQTCFSPMATRAIADSGVAPYSGRFLPEGNFDLFRRGPVNGTWKLQIVDDSRGFEGSLLGWSIQFKEPYNITYTWSTGAQMDSIYVQPTATTDYNLKVEVSYGCSEEDSLTVNVGGTQSVSGLTCSYQNNALLYDWWPLQDASAYEVQVNNGLWENIGALSAYEISDVIDPENVFFAVRPVLETMDCPATALVAECAIPTCQIPAFDWALNPPDCSNGIGASIQVSLQNDFIFQLDTIVNRTGRFDDLAPGVYTLIVRQGDNCFETREVLVPEPASLETSVEYYLQEPSCNGRSDGIVAALVTNSADWSFQWQGGNGMTNASSMNNLPSGTYILQAENRFGCQLLDTLLLQEPLPIEIGTDVQMPSCPGELDAQVTLNVNGGLGPYTYRWANGNQTGRIEDIGAGLYVVTVTDFNGCVAAAEVEVPDPEVLQIDFNVEHPKCINEPSGELEVIISGGIPPYDYQWTNQYAGSNLSGLRAGLYEVTATDVNGCLIVDNVQLIDPLPKALELEVEDVLCSGKTNGSVAILNSDQFRAFRLNNEPFSPVFQFNELESGTYTVEVTDEEGCLYQKVINIEEPYSLELVSSPILNLEYDIPFDLDYSIVNGTEPYLYRWTSRDSATLSCYDCPNPTIIPKIREILTLEVVDALGCVGRQEIDVFVNEEWEVMVPTGFTPNGDGVNDRLIVLGNPDVIINRFEVFNRWGELIYLAEDYMINDYTIGWDGIFKGQQASSDLYLWKVAVTLPNGKFANYVGSSSLLR